MDLLPEKSKYKSTGYLRILQNPSFCAVLDILATKPIQTQQGIRLEGPSKLSDVTSS